MTDLRACPELIDSHCHLDYDYSPKTEKELIEEALTEGVTLLIAIGTNRDSIPRVSSISERYSQVFHTVGVHPHEAVHFRDEDIELLRKAAAHPKCLGIGELGLDYFYDHSPRETQLAILEKQLELALDVALPVIVHSRDAEDDLLSILTRYSKRVSKDQAPGVIHCFSGSLFFGQACIDLGFYISFSGILTFKNTEGLRECARIFPLERLLVETDAPYLAPSPMRGKKCEPKMVKFTAMKLAEVRGVSFEEVAQATSTNTRKLFGI